MRRLAPLASAALFLAIALPAAAASAPAGRGVDRSADPTGRWIVVLKPGYDAPVAAERQGRRMGFRADRTFRQAVRGYSARLDPAQVAALRNEPSVANIVPDEKIELTGQLIPTGVSRIGATGSPVAAIDGLDDRVDADVAIVDTGIRPVTDLNVVGGYGCSNSKPSIWIDNNGHGTHVAGTVGALDNGSGVVGVAPGVRLWAVKILNDSGEGLLSWYVCGLDWIASQRDPSDPTRPLIEAANMSVAKWGADDRNCGRTNNDVLHAAICRVVAAGVTVVAAAANDSGPASKRVPAAYDEVITVSALADTDGQPGGVGGNRCKSWGTYDVDDTFADFSNWGPDVDIIAPGKCIWSTIPSGYGYSSGTSMAAPHVTGAAALLKASRPGLAPAEVREALRALGNSNWRVSTDPDKTHEPLLDVSRIGPRGDFALELGRPPIGSVGGIAHLPIRVERSSTSFERIQLSVTGVPGGATATFAPASLFGFTSESTVLSITIPPRIRVGSYQLTITADEHGNRHRGITTLSVVVDPSAPPPSRIVIPR